MNRFLYLGYYLKSTYNNKGKFYDFLSHASKKANKSKASLLIDALYSSVKYNISLDDYFYFAFYDPKTERDEWAGTGFMYEYHLKNNPKSTRSLLENKVEFLSSYSKYIKRKWCHIDNASPADVESILKASPEKVVVKSSTGQAGQEVKVLNSQEFSSKELLDFMRKNDFDLLETYVMQHKKLKELSPSGLNTVRVMTQLTKEGEVEILGARLRVSVDTPIDNLAAGNFAVPLDIKTGNVSGNGVFSDISKEDVEAHPITKVVLKDFHVPNWGLVIDTVSEAALLFPQNKSIGWDVAVLDDGVELIEGNHNWCKLLYQLPVKKGLKKTLLPFC